MSDYAHIAAKIISRAREAWSNSPEHDNATSDGFDYHIAVDGLRPFGELYNETYVIANEGFPQIVEGSGLAELDRRKERAGQLWLQVLPELESYAADCKAAKFTGWSMGNGPVRRVRDKGSPQRRTR